jgi:ATP-dependent protease ClpP protease subunit
MSEKHRIMSVLLIVTCLVVGLFYLPNDSENIVSTTWKNRIVYTHTGLIFRQIDIRLSTEIGSPEKYTDVLETLDTARFTDTIRFHLAGFGGDVMGVLDLVQAVHSTKAKVIMIVESDVYSAHSYLATQGDELIVKPSAYLMFHTVSTYGTPCNLAPGTDRTVSNVEHCQSMLDADIEDANRFIDSITILTPEQKQRIETGHDVYIHNPSIDTSMIIFNKRVRY